MHKSLTLDALCPSASSPPELPQVLDKKEQHLWGGGDGHSDSTPAVTVTAQDLGGPGLTQGITLKVVTLEVGNSLRCQDSLKAPNEG